MPVKVMLPSTALPLRFSRGSSPHSRSTLAPMIGVTPSLAKTLTVTSALPTSRSLTSAVCPAATLPLSRTVWPVTGSTAVRVKLPALTTGTLKLPSASVKTFSSWIPWGMEAHDISPPLVSRQNCLNSSDL